MKRTAANDPDQDRVAAFLMRWSLVSVLGIGLAALAFLGWLLNL